MNKQTVSGLLVNRLTWRGSCYGMWPQTCRLILQTTKHTTFITTSIKAGNGDFCLVTVLQTCFQTSRLSGRVYELPQQVYSQTLDRPTGRLTPEFNFAHDFCCVGTVRSWIATRCCPIPEICMHDLRQTRNLYHKAGLLG